MADIFIQHFRAHFLIWKLFHIDWNFIIIFLWGKSHFTKYWWHSLLTHIYASLNIRLLTHICQQVQLVNLHNFVSLTCEMQVHLSFSMLSAISSENISCIWYEISSNSTSLHETNQSTQLSVQSPQPQILPFLQKLTLQLVEWLLRHTDWPMLSWWLQMTLFQAIGNQHADS